MVFAAFSNNLVLFLCVATMVPLPGKANPTASFRQFMELAVNIPEHDPQVGQAFFSTSLKYSSEILESPAITIASTKSRCLSPTNPASIGPPETKTAGIFSLIDAINIPGVILSQLL